MSVYEHIRQAVEQHASDQQAAVAVYMKVNKIDLMMLIKRECQHVRRQLDRRTERQLVTPTINAQGAAADPVGDRQRFLAARCYSDQGAPLWEDATKEDVLARISYLERIKAGLQETIDFCEEIVVLLDIYNAARVGELPDEAFETLANQQQEAAL